MRATGRSERHLHPRVRPQNSSHAKTTNAELTRTSNSCKKHARLWERSDSVFDSVVPLASA